MLKLLKALIRHGDLRVTPNNTIFNDYIIVSGITDDIFINFKINAEHRVINKLLSYTSQLTTHIRLNELNEIIKTFKFIGQSDLILSLNPNGISCADVWGCSASYDLPIKFESKIIIQWLKELYKFAKKLKSDIDISYLNEDCLHIKIKEYVFIVPNA